MKKILSFVLMAPLLLVLTVSLHALEKTKYVYIHYYRYQSDYTDWDLWIWPHEPEAGDGSAYEFEEDDTATTFNWGGVVSKIELNNDLESATKIGFIVRRGDWLEKDVDLDRFIEIPAESDDNGIHHVYLVENDQAIGTSINDPNGPSRFQKFRQAFFTSSKTIEMTVTESIVETEFKLLINGIEADYESLIVNNLKATLTLKDDLDFSNNYQVSTTFSDGNTDSYDVTFDGIYDSDEFSDAYGYEGSDLGAIASDLKTTFRLWAPISSKVTLNLYETGTVSEDKTPLEVIDMIPSDKGTYYYESNTNLHGTYYTYSVTNGANTFEVVDPYARSTGVNGQRGLVVDFSKTNPDGWEYNNLAENITHNTDAIIYELHVRDLTIHESWNGNEENRGKFLGLAEEGTKYMGHTTGFDHIKELGVTHVQLLPFFDFGVVDETRLDDPDYNSFNWGYMPLHFNTLEGSYSSNPYDGLVRINEMKQVVDSYTKANIRINMDVVYNHTGLSADSNFNLIVPGYYHRMTANNAFSNGSGTGNEMASERYMTRKFIVDSVEFWAKEYNIAGFRFDLMALHDLETMNKIVEVLHEIDPTIMIYGEPWMGGSTTLSASEQAGKQNLHLLDQVGAFNDDLRDGVKGSVFMSTDSGFIQGNFSNQNIMRIKYGIAGGTNYPSIEGGMLTAQKVWHTSPQKTLNYVTAHDNNTLHDKLYMTLDELDKLDLLNDLMKQGNAIVLTSQGIPFLHAGDEFARSKPAIGGNGFDHNSYESPDSVNQMRWDLKVNNLELVNYYKGLISLRNSEELFRLKTASDISDKLNFIYENQTGIIAYTLTDEDNNVLVIHNANQKGVRVKLPTGGGWRVIVDGENAGTTTLYTYEGGKNVKLDTNTTYVMYQDSSISDVDNTLLIIGIIVGSVIILGGAGTFIFIKLRKKKL